MPHELTPRQEVLMMFIGSDSEKKLDPIRIMKGLFIIDMEAPVDWLPADARYGFEPYNYGPYSSDIYSDLEQLMRLGYVDTSRAFGQSWSYYSSTDEGVREAQAVSEQAKPELAGYCRRVRDFVDSLSFRELLTKVYERYPDYAVNSVFQRQQ